MSCFDCSSTAKMLNEFIIPTVTFGICFAAYIHYKWFCIVSGKKINNKIRVFILLISCFLICFSFYLGPSNIIDTNIYDGI